MNMEMTPIATELMQKAITQAKDYEDTKVRPEHILLAILIHEHNIIIDILTNLNIDIEKLFEDLSLHLTNNIINNSRIYSNNYEILPSPETKFVIEQMTRESERLGDEVVSEIHIMLAILKTNCVAQRLLVKLNLNYKIFKDKLMNNIKNEINTPEDFSSPTNPIRRTIKSDGQNKTPALDGFCRDISKAASDGNIDNVIGRDEEIKRVTAILSRRKKNNPVLIGEAGVGKTSIVEGLAILMNSGDVPKPLLGKKIYSLDLASIVAGTKYRGQFEERMKVILAELKDNPNIILFIDELHTLVGAGNASGSLDASNIFKPALARGEIQIIGATTLDEFREKIESDGALTRRFQQVIINQPSLTETIEILNNIRDNYEIYHNVKYSDEMIRVIVKMADRYISDRAMPDKAIDVLDEVGASTNIDIKLPPQINEMKDKIKDVKKQMGENVRKQDYETAATLRDKRNEYETKLEIMLNKWEEKNEKESTVITQEMIESTISMMTGIPLTKVTSSENNTLKNLEEDLKKQIIGQDDAVKKISKAIRRGRLGIRSGKKPIGSFIFLGPTGVGKTHLAKIISEEVFGDSDALIRVDMSEYMERFAITRLIGSPPGYVGYGEGGKLTEAVRRKPYSVILFDEIEKAHEDVFNLLLQLLDEGHITDSNDRKVDFKNTLIIMTSNIGVKELSQFGTGIGYSTSNSIIDDEERAKSIIQKALKDKFKPEFLNRIDETIIFNSLSQENLNMIIKNEIKEVKERISDLKYKLNVTKPAMEFIALEGYHKEYGARPLKRAIQKYIEDPITDEIMDGNLKEGGTIKISYSSKDGITTKVIN